MLQQPLGNVTPPLRKKHLQIIRFAFVVGQFATTFLQFLDSIVTLTEPSEPENFYTTLSKFATAAFFSLIAASIFAYTTNKFQGEKIMTNPYDEPESYDPWAPRNPQSNFFECAYLGSSILATTTNKFFTFLAVLSLFKDNKIIEIVGFTIFATSTLFGEIPFNLSNAWYEPSEQIKYHYTKSKESSLASCIIKYFTNPLPKWWVINVGTFVHTLADFVGLVLCIPKKQLITLYETPSLFWTIMVPSAIPLTLLVFINLMQTRYFEGAESEKNFKKILSEDDNEAEAENTHKPPFYRILKHPLAKLSILGGFLTQAPIHAAADAMPAIVVPLDLLSKLVVLGLLSKPSTLLKVAITLPALFIFLSSTTGNLLSEVKYSIHNFLSPQKYGPIRFWDCCCPRKRNEDEDEDEDEGEDESYELIERPIGGSPART